jgi:hypothetical protein
VNPAPKPERNARRSIGRAAILLAIVFTAWLPAGLLGLVPFVFLLPGQSGLRSHAGAAVACLLVAAWAYWNEENS